MTSLVPCPDATCLAAMLDEALPQAEQKAAQQHVDQCPSCQRRLEVLIAGGGEEPLQLDLLSNSPSTSHATAAEGLPTARDKQPRSSGGGPVEFPFLAPALEPAALGRLGHYEILEVVGRGGMGIVFKARDTHLARIVAIKALAPELAAKGLARSRFLREARAAAAVSHDHVITIYAVEEGEQRAVPFIAMELIDGQTLEQKIERAGELPLVEILRIGHQIASGLAAAHAQGLIHRDIKPANILLQNGIQRVKITDFGLARLANGVGLTQTGVVAGTPQYMSPEQALGQPVDARSDLFSLGSVLYAMCTGRSPFRAETAVAALRRVCDDSPRPVRELNPEIPEWLAALIHRMLEKQPANRFASSAEVAALLGQHLARHQQSSLIAAHLPLAAMRGQPVHGQSSPNRRPLWTVIGLAMLTAVVLLAVSEAVQLTNLTGTMIPAATGAGKPATQTAQPSTDSTASDRTNSKPSSGAADSASAAPIFPPDDGQVEAQPAPAIAPFSAEQARLYQKAWARHLGVPVEYTNSIGMKLRLIPPGEFVAGNSPQEVTVVLAMAEELMIDLDGSGLRELYESEAPQHRVKLSQPWYLGACEVTQAQYQSVMGHNGSHFSATGPAKDKLLEQNTSHYPVEMVSWNYAATFCSRLNSLEQLGTRYRQSGGEIVIQPAAGYRLPSEALWEFACRAGSDTRFWFGPTGENLASFAWFGANSQDQTHPVAQREPNPLGLYDMLGNVSEWCEDGYDPAYYAQLQDQLAVDPDGPPPGFLWRVFKGGNYSHSFLGCRSAARGTMGPQRRESTVGWRVALPAATVQRQLIEQRSKSDLPQGASSP